MRYLFITVFVLFLFGCRQQTKQTTANDIAKPVVYNTSTGDKIVFLEDYFRIYLKAIKTNYANRNKIYEEEIKDTIFSNYFLKSEYSELIKNMLSSAIKDTSGLRMYISEIVSNRAEIEEIITSALTESSKYLKNDSLTIYILPCNADIEKVIMGKGGVSGTTAGSKQILITINPGMVTWKEMLSYNIAREFDHTCWTKMNFNKSAHPTLLDYLVSEGRADSYAHLIYPTVICPWTKVLSGDIEAGMWNKIKSQLQNQDISFQYNVMFGYSSDYILWGGFTLGYHIVQSALKNYPKLTPAEWNNLPSEKILEMSDYK